MENIHEKTGAPYLTFVEDTMSSLPYIQKFQDKQGVDCRFGLVVRVGEDKDYHKINVFPLNKAGFLDLYKIHDIQERDGQISQEDLLTRWSENLHLAIPFYDSFIFQNALTFSNFLFQPERFGNFSVFRQENGLPFDPMIGKLIEKYGDKIQDVKSIYYEGYDDFNTFLTYKIICHRSFGSNSLSRPNKEFCGSNRFCLEDYLAQVR